MNILRKSLIAAACAAALVSTTGNLLAQGGGGRGNFDPVQMKQDRLANLREQMDIKDDAEWTAIEGKLSKAYDARASVIGLAMRGAFGRGGPRRNNNGNGDDQGQRPRRPPPFGEPSPAFEALQKAIEDKAPSAEIKTKLAAYRAEVKDRQAKFEAAQEDLRGVLTARQEAIATVNGLLQ
jgi:hypothetical protein